MSRARSKFPRPAKGPPPSAFPSRIGLYPERKIIRFGVRLLKLLDKVPRAWRARVGLPTSSLAEIPGDFTLKELDASDEFNKAFVSHGWIAYESMSAPVCRQALVALQSHGLEQAEKVICGHYDRETMSSGIMRMRGSRVMGPRFDLAELAAEDHFAGRFHASVPVVLSIMDGIAADVNPDNVGFFGTDRHLTAWNSIAGHPSGLESLSDVMSQSRMKTGDEPLRIPYRHGILHGRDLGYANHLVSTKCFAALFAMADFVRLVESNRHTVPPPAPPGGFIEWLRSFPDRIADHDRFMLAVESFSPRTSVAIPDGIGLSTPPATPESCAVLFCNAVNTRNYGAIAQLIVESKKDPISVCAGRVRGTLEEPTGPESRLLHVVAVVDSNCFMSSADIRTPDFDARVKMNIGYYDEGGELLPRDVSGGRWLVANFYAVSRQLGFGR